MFVCVRSSRSILAWLVDFALARFSCSIVDSRDSDLRAAEAMCRIRICKMRIRPARKRNAKRPGHGITMQDSQAWPSVSLSGFNPALTLLHSKLGPCRRTGHPQMPGCPGSRLLICWPGSRPLALEWFGRIHSSNCRVLSLSVGPFKLKL